MPRTKALSI